MSKSAEPEGLRASPARAALTGRARASFHALLESTFRIRPGEGRRTGILFTHLLLASAVFVLGRTVRDTLFLSRLKEPLRVLPWMFVLYGVASALATVFYGRVADRYPRHRLILISVTLGILSYLGVYAFTLLDAGWIYPVFYVWSEVVANLFLVQFWTLANDLHDARSAKRLFGTIGSARILGIVLVGLGTGAAVRAIGTAQLLLVLVVLMGGIALAALAVRKERPTEPGARGAGRPGRRGGEPPRVHADPYVRSLTAVTLLTFVVLTVGDFQFKAVARATYQGDSLARYFSLFYAGTGVAAYLFQLLATPRILGRLGVGWGMAVMPGVFGPASALLLLFPRLLVATVLKFADNGFQYSIHETTQQALYVPFAPEVKARTRALLDAQVKPLSYGAGGLLLALIAHRFGSRVEQLSYVTVPLVGLWLLLIPPVRRRYQQSLEATLMSRGSLALDHDFVLDAASRRALLRVLAEGEPRKALVALERLSAERSPELERILESLTRNPDPALRAEALKALVRQPDPAEEPARRALQDPVPAVRAAAAQAVATLCRDEGVEDLAPLLEDPDPAVREAALAGLLEHGGVEGGIVGGAALGRLLAANDRGQRIEAANALRWLGRGAYRPLRRLLEDPDAAVRRAALRAAPGVPDPRLVPLLVRKARDPACLSRAGRALVAVGPPALEPLLAELKAPEAPRALKLAVPRLVRQLADPDAYGRLRGHIGHPDGHVRLRVLAALAALRQEHRLPAEPAETVDELLRREIKDAARHLVGWSEARESHGSPLLAEASRLQQARAIRRSLRILELRYERESLRLVRKSLGDRSLRANALELLDSLLEPRLRPLVMPFFDDAPEAQALARARELAAPAPSALEFLLELCQEPDPYLACLAFHALAACRDPAAEAAAVQALRSAEPLRRESALVALRKLAPEGLPELARPLLADPDPATAAQARTALARPAGGSPEVAVYSTIEKLMFLKAVPMFSRVSGEDLVPLARVAESETHAPGSVVFRTGELGDALFIVLHGKVSIERDGNRIGLLGPSEAFGEMAVLDAVARSASAIAVEETELLRIESEEFYEILHSHAEIAQGVILMLTHRLRETMAAAPGASGTD